MAPGKQLLPRAPGKLLNLFRAPCKKISHEAPGRLLSFPWRQVNSFFHVAPSHVASQVGFFIHVALGKLILLHPCIFV